MADTVWNGPNQRYWTEADTRETIALCAAVNAQRKRSHKGSNAGAIDPITVEALAYAEGVSAEYQVALDASRVASQQYAEVCRRYRAREIGDAEYLVGREAHTVAERAFDVAYAAECERVQS